MEKNNETKADNNEDKISICKLVKDDTSEVMRKLESKIPLHAQNYSNLYTAHLRSIGVLFDTCYISEKEFLDRLDIDQGIQKQMREHSRIAKENYLNGIEIGTKLLDDCIKMGISAMKTSDDNFQTTMRTYFKMLSQFNGSLKPSL
mgnify:CR=1 FL=1